MDQMLIINELKDITKVLVEIRDELRTHHEFTRATVEESRRKALEAQEQLVASVPERLRGILKGLHNGD